MQWMPRQRRQVDAEGNDRFFMTAITGSIVFERDASGKVIGAVATVFGRPERIGKTS